MIQVARQMKAFAVTIAILSGAAFQAAAQDIPELPPFKCQYSKVKPAMAGSTITGWTVEEGGRAFYPWNIGGGWKCQGSIKCTETLEVEEAICDEFSLGIAGRCACKKGIPTITAQDILTSADAKPSKESSSGECNNSTALNACSDDTAQGTIDQNIAFLRDVIATSADYHDKSPETAFFETTQAEFAINLLQQLSEVIQELGLSNVPASSLRLNTMEGIETLLRQQTMQLNATVSQHQQ